jgi:outer membrane protein OmpA-like peptidoglycan-associated protein
VPTAVTTTVAFTTLPLVITLPPTLPPTPTILTTTAPTTAPTTVPPVSTTTTVAGDVTVPVRSIRYEGGVIHLEGAVPDQATFDTLSNTMAAVVGADRIDARYSIIPGTALPTSEPMFFPDRFKFAPNSSTLAPEDIAVLDQVMVFLVQNPQVTLDIKAYTDSAGPDDSNLELSQIRANTIWAYLLYGGIDPVRVTAHGLGEADPIADNATEAGRTQNRRVEFLIHDLLG